MSLTSHLKDPRSRVRKFLYRQFPNAASVARECRGRLAGTATIRPATRVPYSTLGMAFDYRLRYYFAVTPVEGLAAWRGAQLLDANEVMELVRSDTGQLREPLPWGLAKQFLESAQDVLKQILLAARFVGRDSASGG